MPRHKLEFDPPETDFLLFGICSQSKDYRLVWIINKNLCLELKRTEDVIPDGLNRFALFSFEKKETRQKHFLVANKNENGLFMKELKQIDYLFIVEGNEKTVDSDHLLLQIKQSETVLAVYKLNAGIIKTMQHFFFE